MNLRRTIRIFLILFIFPFASACTASTPPPPAPTEVPTRVPTETPVPTKTPEPTLPPPTPTETLEPTITFTPTELPPLGESGNPIVIALVPGIKKLSETDLMGITSLINQEVENSVQVVMVENYADAVVQLCDGRAHATILNTNTYLEAHKMGCADATLLSRSDGSSNFDGKIIFRQESGITNLESLYGKNICRPFWTPNIFNDGNPESMVRAVYEGACEASLVKADVREELSTVFPDVLDIINILDETIAYPHDNISFATGLPEDVRIGLTQAFVYLSLFNGGQAIKEIYGWDNLIRIDNSYYKALRDFYFKAAIGPDESGLSVGIFQIEDQFNHPDETSFSIEEYETGALFVAGGKYVTISLQGSVWGVMEPNYNFADMVIDVEATIVTQPESGTMEANIRCREQDNNDGYRFLLNGEGQAAVIKITDRNEAEALMGWTNVENLQPNGVSNRLRVICAGNTLTFSINGIEVYKGQDDAFRSGNIGLGVYTSEAQIAEVHFDNLFIGGRK